MIFLLWVFLFIMVFLPSLFIVLKYCHLRGPLLSLREKYFLGIFLFIISASTLFLYDHLGASSEIKNLHKQKKIEEMTVALREELNTPERVIERLKKRLEENPDSAEGWYLLGRIYFSEAKFKEAAEVFAKAHELKPDAVNISMQYAQSLFFWKEKHWSSDIQTLIDDVLKTDPDNEAAINLLAIHAYEENRNEEAITYWEKLLQKHSPDSEDGKVLLNAIAAAQKRLGGEN